MPLTLAITQTSRTDKDLQLTKVFETRGGTIGRTQGNDWVLPDPERFVSSSHAKIQYRNGAYCLLDTSTNGVFVNGASQPVGSGNLVVLHHGDQLLIGDYQISVSLDEGFGPGVVPQNPFQSGYEIGEGAAQPSGSGAQGTTSLDPLRGDASVPRQEQIPDDPFAFLDKAPLSAPAPWESPEGDASRVSGKPPANLPSFDQGSPLDNFFAAPSASNGGQIPDDWDVDLSPTVPPVGGANPSSGSIPSGGRDSTGAVVPSHPVGDPGSYSDPGTLGRPGALPQDWDEDLLSPPGLTAGHGSASSQSGTQGGLGQLPQDWDADLPPSPPHIASDGLSNVGAASGIGSSGGSHTELPAASQQPSLNVQEEGVPSTPASVSGAVPPSQTSKTTVGGHELQSFLQGLGVAGLDIPPDQAPQMMVAIGEMFRVLVQGVMEVLMARSSLKSEFRMSMTTVRPVENNPLKFSVDVDEALRALLTKQGAGYLAPAAAVREGVMDIKGHQVAMMAGMQAAFQELLRRFDPQALEKAAGKGAGKLGAMMPAGRKAKCWDLYGQHYQEIVQEAEDHFQRLFGDEFARAYEEQIQRLKDTNG